jgi:hypothetical protein
MKSSLTTCVCAALVLPLAAQTGQKPKVETMPAAAEKPAYVGLDKLLGSKVYATGAGGATPTEEASKLELKDFVVDPVSGNVFWAVLENDGHSVAVPPALMECKHKADDPEGDPTLELHVDAAKLKALPIFDLEQAREKSFDPAVIALETSWSSVGIPAPASAPRAKDVSAPTPAVVVTGTEFMALPVRFALASKLDGIDVYARGEDFGDVSDLVLDTKDHHIAYAIVSHGGVLGVGDEKYLVPFKALCVAHPKDDNDKLVLVIDMPKDALAVEAGRYKEPEKGILSKERAEQADKQFEAAIRSKKTGGTDEKSSGRQGSAVRQGG